MNLSFAFVRLFFLILSILFATAFAVSSEEVVSFWTFAWGASLGIIVASLLIGFEFLLKRYPLRLFNTVTLGLFFGFLLSVALLMIFDAIVKTMPTHFSPEIISLLRIFLILFGSYLGVIATLRSSEEIVLSIPFVKFTSTTQNIKDILLDVSVLHDGRIIDLAMTGLFDRRWVLPRFVLKELFSQEESEDQFLQIKARRALETVHKLENLKDLRLRFHETDFPEATDSHDKVMRLARLMDADLLTADLLHTNSSSNEGIRIVSLPTLMRPLKPVAGRGEFLKITIQRRGKDEHQGIGYLEDGSMVVVNGAAEFIGQTIRAYILSVKQTPTGRLIFCNALPQSEEVLT